MITTEDVLNLFKSFAPSESLQGTEKMLSLCDASLQKIMNLISEETDIDDRRIAYASACDAYYMYALGELSSFEENEDFKAGDVSVKKRLSENLKIAENIKQQGIDTLLPLLQSNRFGAWSV